MDIKSKQWSVEETNCLLAVWSSTEIQYKLEGATRTKPVYEQIQREMAAAGFERSIDQINNKLKKLKKDFRDQKKDLERSGSGRPRKSPHFDVLDSVLGDRPACKLTGALNSATATAMLEAMVIDQTLMQDSTDYEPSAIEDVDAEEELPPPLASSSPIASSRSGAQRSSSSSKPQQARQGKRKRESMEMLQYMERADAGFLEHSREMNSALVKKMDASTTGLLGLIGRMVAVMEAQATNL